MTWPRVVALGVLVGGIAGKSLMLQTKPEAKLALENPIIIEVKNSYKFYPEDGTNLKMIRGVGLTYYSRKDGMTPGHTTRSGRFVSEGTIAVSQPLWDKEVSAGDCIYVKVTDRWYRVEDTMSSQYRDKRIDIYTHDMALAKSGSSRTDIIILRQPR
jgi:hypothetical protein